MERAIVIAGTMASCSIAILAANSILEIVLRFIEIFTSICTEKVLRANGGIDPKSKPGTSLSELF